MSGYGQHRSGFPAKAGTHGSAGELVEEWIPACAGIPAPLGI